MHFPFWIKIAAVIALFFNIGTYIYSERHKHYSRKKIIILIIIGLLTAIVIYVRVNPAEFK
ncbi:MAG: hypothetical protein ABIO55_06370 [Ginsengibacter sp.]